jgi:hypothetical protein
MPRQTFTPGFGSSAMDAQKRILDMDDLQLAGEWNSIMQAGTHAKMAVEEEVEKGLRAHVGLFASP